MQHDDIKTAKSLYDEIKKKLATGTRTYLFFDEIQEVASWEKAVNSMMLDFNVDI
jgi:predicted AAA+ superfamily ATPase